MKNAEMQVLRFGAGDVIATSGLLCEHTVNHFHVDNLLFAGQGYNGLGFQYTWNSSTSKFEKGDSPVTLSYSNVENNTFVKGMWYYQSNDGYWKACENNSADYHPTN